MLYVSICKKLHEYVIQITPIYSYCLLPVPCCLKNVFLPIHLNFQSVKI